MENINFSIFYFLVDIKKLREYRAGKVGHYFQSILIKRISLNCQSSLPIFPVFSSFSRISALSNFAISTSKSIPINVTPDKESRQQKSIIISDFCAYWKTDPHQIKTYTRRQFNLFPFEKCIGLRLVSRQRRCTQRWQGIKKFSCLCCLFFSPIIFHNFHAF